MRKLFVIISVLFLASSAVFAQKQEQQKCLFTRPARQSPPKPDKGSFWMSNSTANPEVITPDRSHDGNWWLLVRGGDGKNSRVGVYTQKADKFKPLGPWKAYINNPVLDINMVGEVDNRGAIDQCGVTGPDGKFYMFYKGQHWRFSKDDPIPANSVLYTVSDDGFHYSQPQIWKMGIGISHMIKGPDGQYYLFVARRVYVLPSPTSTFEEATLYNDIIQKGTGPDGFDSYSINGCKVCHLEGVDKWFMFYQGSSDHDDFPARFHVAMSDDLIHWEKVQNDFPLFLRGEEGEWDQGAIWAPAVFEWKGMLYMYYEGWGCEGFVPDRNKRYFPEGHSEIGIATCPKEDFLRWCGLID